MPVVSSTICARRAGWSGTPPDGDAARYPVTFLRTRGADGCRTPIAWIRIRFGYNAHHLPAFPALRRICSPEYRMPLAL